MSLFKRPDRIVDDLIRSRFLVTCDDGATFAGILWDTDDLTLHLKDPEAVQPSGDRVKADSDVFVPRSRVAYMQLLTD